MKKWKFVYILFFLFVTFLQLSLSSCGVKAEDFNASFKDFLLENGSRTFISKCEMVSSYIGKGANSQGNYNISAEKDFELNYILVNSENYKFELNKNLFIELPELSDGQKYSVSAIQKSSTVLQVILTSDFLQAANLYACTHQGQKDWAFTPTITIKHPKTNETLDVFNNGPKLRPNIAPNNVTDIAVFKNKEEDDYLVTFNLPENIIEPFNYDVDTLVVEIYEDGNLKNSKKVPLQISLSDDSLLSVDVLDEDFEIGMSVPSQYAEISSSYVAGGFSVVYKTGIIANGKTYKFNIYLIDSAELASPHSSSIEVNEKGLDRSIIYVDAVNGNDENIGYMEDSPVATMQTAHSLIKGVTYKIVMLSSYTISDSESNLLDFREFSDERTQNIVIERGAGVNGALFSIERGNSVAVRDVTIDGINSVVNGPLIEVDSASSVDIYDNVILKNNVNNVNDGKGGAIYNKGMLTIFGGEICNNRATSGGAIYNEGTLQIFGGEICDNVATSGGAIYVLGTFNMSGAAYIPAGDNGKNDVYLYDGNYITITGDLTQPDGKTIVATITPASYNSNPIVLKGDTEELLTANILKFELSSEDYAIIKDPSTLENGIIVNNTPCETVYLDAASGNDFNDGSASSTAVKTLPRAIKLLKSTATPPKIIVLSAYTLSSGEEELLNRAGATGNRITIERGVATGDVMEISSGNVIISNITFDGKKDTYTSTGSLLRISDGTTTITNCTFSNNTTTNGGGIYVDSGAVVTMTDSTISSNTATNGGGIYMAGGTFKMTSGTISGNEATSGSGGGIYVATNGTLTMEGGKISGNTATTGGGVYMDNSGCTFNMNDGTISSNTASNYGGGVFVDGTLTMTGGTISGNTATSGDSVYVNNTFKMSGTAQILVGDVYLPDGKYITITGALTGTTPVATITPASYTDGTQVLEAGGSVTMKQDICNQFAISDKTFAIVQDTTKGVLKQVKAGGSIALPGDYTITVGGVTPGTDGNLDSIAPGGTIELTLKNSSGEIVTSAEWCIELRQNSDTIMTAETNPITLPNVPDGIYELYIKFTVGTQTYDTTYAFKVMY